jgi:Ni2+-binding GTPase involved in maturation of urease and hydrogenase
MKAIMVVGCTGSGKTYFVKSLIKNVNPKNIIVYDVNDEYKDVYPYPFEPDIDKFLSGCLHKRGKVMIFEDATSFFAVQGRSDEMIKLLIAKRHTKNTIILIFHSFGDVPRYLFRKCTDIAIFKTLDGEKDVNKLGIPYIIEAWKEVQEQAKTSKFFSKYPPPKKSVPPYKVLKLY